MVLITNFGDVTTTGNSTVNGSLTVLGTFSSFADLRSATGLQSIGNTAVPFSQVWANTFTATTANVMSIYGTQGFVGVATTNPQGTTL